MTTRAEKWHKMTMEGVTHAEIAAAEGLAPNTITSVLYKYRKKHGIKTSKGPKSNGADFKLFRPKKITHGGKGMAKEPMRPRIPTQNMEAYAASLKRGTCRFIDGDIIDAPKFCDQPARPGKPYCERHYGVCYPEPMKRSDR